MSSSYIVIFSKFLLLAFLSTEWFHSNQRQCPQWTASAAAPVAHHQYPCFLPLTPICRWSKLQISMAFALDVPGSAIIPRAYDSTSCMSRVCRIHRSETSDCMACMAGSPHLAKKQSCKQSDVVCNEEQPTDDTKNSFA